MSTHQMEQMDEQHPAATGLDSSDEEDEEDKRQKRKQREHESDHGQPNESSRKPRTTQGDTSRSSEDIAIGTHELPSFQGLTVKASVYVRKNPTRGARPQQKEETKEPNRKKATKGPAFKGTYMQRTGLRGGGLKFMIRLGVRAIEIMEGTYEKAKPPKRGNER